MPGYKASEKLNNEIKGKTALNEEVPAHGWQQKVKHVIKRTKILGRTIKCILYIEKSQGHSFINFRNFRIIWRLFCKIVTSSA